MVKTGIKLIFLCRSNKELTENKGKTWSGGTNSRLPFGVNVNLSRVMFTGNGRREFEFSFQPPAWETG